MVGHYYVIILFNASPKMAILLF